MASEHPYIHRVNPSQVLMGFLFADTLLSHQAYPLVGPHNQKKVRDVLQAQLHLVRSLWEQPVAAWDLRFVKSKSLPDVVTGLVCRFPVPAQIHADQLAAYCQKLSHSITHMFQATGYTLRPIVDQAVLTELLAPFPFHSLAEIRRAEEVLELREVYNVYEVYITYPWEWRHQTSQRFFDRLSQLSEQCLVSVGLLPTQLSEQEMGLLNHATTRGRSMLWHAGPPGRRVLHIYEHFICSLQQPFLVRISLAGSSQGVVEEIGQVLRDELPGEIRPVLQYPQSKQELQTLEHNLHSLAGVFWGDIRQYVPDTARLRYLMNSEEASMAFRLPVSKNPAQTVKVLLVLANPFSSTIHLRQEHRAIQEAIVRSRYRDNISLTVCPASTIRDLRRALLEQDFQIAHIASHGSEEGLILEGEHGGAYTVSKENLARLFHLRQQQAGNIRCVILNACYSVEQGGLPAIPFTITMQGPLGSTAAIEFSRGFYDAIGAGKDIEAAYAEGCLAASLEAIDAPFRPQIFRNSC